MIEFLSRIATCLLGCVKRLRNFLSLLFVPNNFSKISVYAYEKKYFGTQGYASKKSFWTLTMLTSLGVGLWATLYGVEPIDIFIAFTRNEQYVTQSAISWQYAFCSVFGCLIYNLFVARVHVTDGYKIHNYIISIFSCLIFLLLPRIFAMLMFEV